MEAALKSKGLSGISVIIPALNEEKNIGRCIEGVLAEEAAAEIIVVDGGSADCTAEVAGRYGGVKVLHSARGRGRQMNSGALAAKGDIFLFLHADTRLETGWARNLLSAAGGDSVSAGAFSFRIDACGMHYRIIEFWVRLRCSAFKLPYGDQGVFVRRAFFEGLGGYSEIPLMEDVEFMERAKKAGRIVILRKRAYTAPRRWEKKGWIRTSLLNQYVMMLYRLGVDPGKLAEIYYGRD